MIKSAFFPGSSEPRIVDIPSAAAPPLVTIAATCRAELRAGSPWWTLWSFAAVSISWKMSKLLLLAQPSVPKPTLTPAANISGRGATPEANFMLLSGLWETPTSLRAKSSISSSFTITA